jgi:DNA-directed RNA polymerase specialized sigma24 family protein
MGALPSEPAAMPGPRSAVGVEDGSPPWSAQRTGQAVTGRDVCAALAMLRAEHRQVIVEMYYHHRSVAETAELLCIRASKVVSLASSAVRQLPRALAASASSCGPSPRLPVAHAPTLDGSG